MSQQLINHSLDLKRLRDEGFEIEVKGGYLLTHHIPYLNSRGYLMYGSLVTDLTLVSSTITAKPGYHVMHFIGEHPCNKDGSIISSIQHTTVDQTLYKGVTVNHSFSNKPANGYSDYYEKVTRYVDIISAPAKSVYSDVTEKTFKVIPTDDDDDSAFHYVDTNSSRASIHLINAKFCQQKIGIVGLGGTGAYILDLVAKTPVQEAHIFDGDLFHTHNAFRSPGAASIERLSEQLTKVEYYSSIYANMHRRIIPHACFITEENMAMLDEMSYVFICVDKNSVRRSIIAYLLQKQIPFIDVGLGVNVVDDCLIGTMRVTSGTSKKSDHITSRIPEGNNDNNEYATNIQIADLNMFNASMAVIKWKKLSGFYQDLEREHHSLYSINDSALFNEDLAA